MRQLELWESQGWRNPAPCKFPPRSNPIAKISPSLYGRRYSSTLSAAYTTAPDGQEYMHTHWVAYNPADAVSCLLELDTPAAVLREMQPTLTVSVTHTQQHHGQ